MLVSVGRARGLLTKGKNGSNDAFVVIKLGKEKSRTSVKLKAPPNVEWNEECELMIPSQGNTADVTLTVFHQNFTGVDEFLGTVSLPLSSFDVYQHPRAKWYQLKSKAGQENKTKLRGDIEVRIAFTVKSGSMLDLSRKDKLRDSLGQLSNAAQTFGGSLLNLGGREKKRLKALTLKASSVSKLKFPGRGRLGHEERGDGRLSVHSTSTLSDAPSYGEADPGIDSDDDDDEFQVDDSRHSSSNLNFRPSSLENVDEGEVFRTHSVGKRSAHYNAPDSLPQRVVLGKEKSRNESGSNASSTSQQDHDQYAASHADKSREELFAALMERDQQIKDLNDYIDSLLLKVMTTCPNVLQRSTKGRTVTRKK